MRVRSIALWGGDYDGQIFEVDKDLDVRSGMVPLLAPLEVDDAAYYGTDWIVRGVRLFVHEQLRGPVSDVSPGHPPHRPAADRGSLRRSGR